MAHKCLRGYNFRRLGQQARIQQHLEYVHSFIRKYEQIIPVVVPAYPMVPWHRTSDSSTKNENNITIAVSFMFNK
jgi:hypothetical protein